MASWGAWGWGMGTTRYSFNHPGEVGGGGRREYITDCVGVVPACGGLLGSCWDPRARGTSVGMTYETNKSHIIRAAMEAISMQAGAVLQAMNQDSGAELKQLRVDGGLTHSRLLLEMQADILGVNLYVPHMIETTSFGAALCAGLACGVWKSREEIAAIAKEVMEGDTVRPTNTDPKVREARVNAWNEAVKRSKWAKL